MITRTNERSGQKMCHIAGWVPVELAEAIKSAGRSKSQVVARGVELYLKSLGLAVPKRKRSIRQKRSKAAIPHKEQAAPTSAPPAERCPVCGAETIRWGPFRRCLACKRNFG
jgi:hypothetical protein